VVNESVKKTDKHDAATIAEFLEKDMLPEARLCSETSEQLRRLLKLWLDALNERENGLVVQPLFEKTLVLLPRPPGKPLLCGRLIIRIIRHNSRFIIVEFTPPSVRPS
jgi:hypothetical protein